MVYTVTPALNFRFQSCLVLKTVPLVRMHKCADHLLDDVESTTTELELIPFTKLLLTLHTRLLLRSFEVVLHGKRVFIYLTQHAYNIILRPTACRLTPQPVPWVLYQWRLKSRCRHVCGFSSCLRARPW